ncbi:MAG: hypothetical protein KIT84_07405 [Labilithrix sp.]|nr:hypothetical protein [Labilithrix sp.]MCW5810821.1 hypothetical protein [Labilithrix sp.]
MRSGEAVDKGRSLRFEVQTVDGLRHTAITRWAVGGKSQLFLLTVAGHMNVTMTKKYLGKAASVSAKFGTPHPPLPASILGGAEVIVLRPASNG